MLCGIRVLWVPSFRIWSKHNLFWGLPFGAPVFLLHTLGRKKCWGVSHFRQPKHHHPSCEIKTSCCLMTSAAIVEFHRIFAIAIAATSPTSNPRTLFPPISLVWECSANFTSESIHFFPFYPKKPRIVRSVVWIHSVITKTILALFTSCLFNVRTVYIGNSFKKICGDCKHAALFSNMHFDFVQQLSGDCKHAVPQCTLWVQEKKKKTVLNYNVDGVRFDLTRCLLLLFLWFKPRCFHFGRGEVLGVLDTVSAFWNACDRWNNMRMRICTTKCDT